MDWVKLRAEPDKKSAWMTQLSKTDGDEQGWGERVIDLVHRLANIEACES
jgi:hypothetical protein